MPLRREKKCVKLCFHLCNEAKAFIQLLKLVLCSYFSHENSPIIKSRRNQMFGKKNQTVAFSIVTKTIILAMLCRYLIHNNLPSKAKDQNSNADHCFCNKHNQSLTDGIMTFLIVLMMFLICIIENLICSIAFQFSASCHDFNSVYCIHNWPQREPIVMISLPIELISHLEVENGL